MNTGKKIISALVISTFLLAGAYTTFAAQQTICPVMGNKLSNKRIFIDYKGKRIYFCCPPCPSNFKRNPEGYLERLAKIGQFPEDIPGTK